MLYYDSLNLSEVIEPTKSNRSKECIICHYHIFNHGFKFQDSVCNGCHNLVNSSLNFSDIPIITVKNVDYCCIIHNINKSEAINLLENSVLENRQTFIRQIVRLLAWWIKFKKRKAPKNR